MRSGLGTPDAKNISKDILPGNPKQYCHVTTATKPRESITLRGLFFLSPEQRRSSATELRLCFFKEQDHGYWLPDEHAETDRTPLLRW